MLVNLFAVNLAIFSMLISMASFSVIHHRITVVNNFKDGREATVICSSDGDGINFDNKKRLRNFEEYIELRLDSFSEDGVYFCFLCWKSRDSSVLQAYHFAAFDGKGTHSECEPEKDEKEYDCIWSLQDDGLYLLNNHKGEYVRKKVWH